MNVNRVFTSVDIITLTAQLYSTPNQSIYSNVNFCNCSLCASVQTQTRPALSPTASQISLSSPHSSLTEISFPGRNAHTNYLEAADSFAEAPPLTYRPVHIYAMTMYQKSHHCVSLTCAKSVRQFHISHSPMQK